MDTKTITSAAIGALIIGCASFYAGVVYANHARSARITQGGTNAQFFARGTGGPGARNGADGGFIAGTVISKDASSVTIQLGGPNASTTNSSATGSKIVLYNGSTQVGKFDSVTPDALSVGDMITVQGSQNADGSITAQTIQIRIAGSPLGPRTQ